MFEGCRNIRDGLELDSAQIMNERECGITREEKGRIRRGP